MQNFVQPGEKITYLNETGSTITSGSPVVIGSLVGVAMGDIADDVTGEVLLEGVVTLTKTNPLAIAQGDELFWSTGTNKVTKTATDKPLGTAHAAAASADGTVDVKLYGRGNGIPVAANVAQITTANGSDAATTQALANTTKTSVNAILTALKNAGIMVADA